MKDLDVTTVQRLLRHVAEQGHDLTTSPHTSTIHGVEYPAHFKEMSIWTPSEHLDNRFIGHITTEIPFENRSFAHVRSKLNSDHPDEKSTEVDLLVPALHATTHNYWGKYDRQSSVEKLSHVHRRIGGHLHDPSVRELLRFHVLDNNNELEGDLKKEKLGVRTLDDLLKKMSSLPSIGYKGKEDDTEPWLTQDISKMDQEDFRQHQKEFSSTDGLITSVHPQFGGFKVPRGLIRIYQPSFSEKTPNMEHLYNPATEQLHRIS